jgi:acetoin utilization protein AcuB
MLVEERMTRNPITVRIDTPVAEAQSIMRREKIHHLPILDNADRLVGIVAEKDLLYASPSPATSLSVYEISYLLAKLTVEKVMTKDPITITEDTPLEDAARIMADNNIGGLPVVRDRLVVGMITESDLFRTFVDLFGARNTGVRVTMYIPQVKGELARISSAIAENGGNIIAFGSVPGDDPTNYLCMIKVVGIPKDELVRLLEPCECRVVDARKV